MFTIALCYGLPRKVSKYKAKNLRCARKCLVLSDFCPKFGHYSLIYRKIKCSDWNIKFIRNHFLTFSKSSNNYPERVDLRYRKDRERVGMWLAFNCRPRKFCRSAVEALPNTSRTPVEHQSNTCRTLPDPVSNTSQPLPEDQSKAGRTPAEAQSNGKICKFHMQIKIKSLS